MQPRSIETFGSRTSAATLGPLRLDIRRLRSFGLVRVRRFGLIAAVFTLFSHPPFPCNAQVASPIATANETATVFGSGDRPRLRYAGALQPTNVLLVQMGYETAYDDNPLGILGGSQPDIEEAFSGTFLLEHQGENVRASIGYEPYYEQFQHYSDHNRLDQAASVDIRLNPESTWSVRLRDSFSSQPGPYLPDSANALPGGAGAPGNLNSTIYGPMSTIQENDARVDLIYQRSARTFADAFAGYGERSFSQVSTALDMYKTRTPDVGAEVAWRPQEHSILGILMLYQRLEALNPAPPKNTTQISITTVLPTIGMAPRPGWQIQLFAGPQYWVPPSTQSSTATVSSAQLDWTAGGSITCQSARNALLFSASRALADGGGILSFVHSSTFEAGLRHHIAGNWDAGADVTFTRNLALETVAPSGSLSELIASAGLVRPVRSNMTLHVNYAFARQMATGGAAPTTEFQRNRISAGMSWQFGAIALRH